MKQLFFLITLATFIFPIFSQEQKKLEEILLRQQREIDLLKEEMQEIKADKQEKTPLQSEVQSSREKWEHPLQAKIAGFKVTLLGFIYAQIAYDSHDPMQRHLSVLGRNFGNDATRFDMDTTRIGLLIENDIPQWKSSLKAFFEIDFRPGNEADPAGPPRFRHAYIEFTTPYINVLIGQTWSIVAQNGPDTMNNDWLYHQGNPGDRFPQFRLWKELEIGNSALTMQAGFAHFNDFAPGKNNQIQQTATNYRFQRYLPQFQARMEFKWDREEKGYLAAGISVGSLHIRDDVIGIEERVTHWLFASELRLPLGPVTLSGEFWIGQAVGYGAGIEQAILVVRTDRVKAIPSIGGWLQLTIHPTSTMRFNLLWGIDDAESEINGLALTKDSNITYLGNIIWDILPYWTVAIECQYVSTHYGNGDRPNDFRTLVATSLAF